MVELTDAPRRGLLPIDRVFHAYLLFNTGVLVTRDFRAPFLPLLLVLNALSAGLPIMLARSPRSRTTDFLGNAYPLLLAAAFYTQLGILATATGVMHDDWVRRLEAALFTGEPALTWHQRMPEAGLSWAMHIGYGSYYLLLAVPPLWLFFGRRDTAAFARLCLAVTTGLYLCYVVFAAFPVAGPRYLWGNATGPAADVLPARLLRQLIEGGSAIGTAFPSSHVAASWCSTIALLREDRRAGLIAAPFALLLALGTVYGQFHYAVDAVAGVLVALLVSAVALRFPRAAPSPPSP